MAGNALATSMNIVIQTIQTVDSNPSGRTANHGEAAGSSDDARTPLQSPRSQNTSRDDYDEEEDESSNANESDTKSPSQRFSHRDDDDDDNGDDDDDDEDDDDEDEPPGLSRTRRSTESSAKAATQSWRNLRAVMAYYNTLRKIKRTKSNQRWMKLRTTVQISSAMQKKPPLKREDSFLQRFSTRQIPEAQETVEDTGSEGCGAAGDAGAGGARRRRRPRKQPRTVVNPDENFYFYWLLIITVCILYNLWTLIVRQSFPELQQLISNFWMACDSLSDVFFILDVCVQLRTGYLEQGLMVYDSRKLAKHYLTSRAFLLDLAALCPLDLLQLRLGAQPLLRCPRFFKVYRAVNYYYMVESRTVYPNLWRVVNLIHILLILAHWFGCFYFLLSQAEGFQGDWVYPYRPGDYATLTRKYLGSLYWSTLTLTTIGDLPTPETNAEQTNSVDGPRSLPRRGVKSRLLQFNNNGGYVFTIVSYLIGVFIFATIVGQVGNVITNRNANRLEFERLLDGAKTYMRHHKVPGGMKRRVLRWYDYSWSRGRIQGGGDINTALGLLPDKLKTELALHVNLSVLKKVTIFQECQPEFLRDLVLKMKAYIFTPGDSICRKGEVAREMFIIADGILEVLSEAGKVLTTMKAGDFFGEIGILNLDGLNKRTADVRSVGYSELFSLSREDVLAAMKDYPEAQEILQALGRKRLMEVKASARHPPRDAKDHHRRHEAHAPDPRSIVGKLKNEAKGLRNVLRKSRTHRRSAESLELQPLHSAHANDAGGHGGAKGMLKRMSRVRSHDLSQEESAGAGASEPSVSEPQQQQPVSVASPLGAGLPLLARLRLLKEKQEHEERTAAAAAVVTPPSVVSPTTVKSPPLMMVQEEKVIQHEVIGAGLPLLQRLLLLKAKEEEKVVLPIGAQISTNSNSNVGLGKPRISFKERLKIMNKDKDVKDKDKEKDKGVSKDKEKDKDKDKGISKDKEKEKDKVKDEEEDDGKNDPLWSRLKKAAIVKEDNLNSNPPNDDSRTSNKLITLTRKTKQYRSIDDLSPEYGGLPFVKKLKILNERQKLEELETVMKTRSFSLDIPDSSSASESLTRSHSEGSTMHHRQKSIVLMSNKGSLNSSSESNETPERRNLKSILKNLTESSAGEAKASELRRLMRAPTVEGYMARHSKLAKSVTFNRDTLQSPPPPASLDNIREPGLPRDSDSGGLVGGNSAVEETDKLCGIQLIAASAASKGGNHQVKLIKASLEEDQQQQQYFGDIVLGIKQVMSNHLRELQEKFHGRFERLEDEIRRRDEIIGQLRGHIFELERAAEESLTDSVETIIAANRSFDSRPRRRRDLTSPSTSPASRHHRRQNRRSSNASRKNHHHGDDVVLEIDSGTDSEAEEDEPGAPEGDVEEMEEDEEDEDEDEDEEARDSDINDDDDDDDGRIGGSSGSNWEIELLAAQIRERRSASLDPNAGRPIRKRFARGGSVEHGKRD